MEWVSKHVEWESDLPEGGEEAAHLCHDKGREELRPSSGGGGEGEGSQRTQRHPAGREGGREGGRMPHI